MQKAHQQGHTGTRPAEAPQTMQKIVKEIRTPRRMFYGRW